MCLDCRDGCRHCTPVERPRTDWARMAYLRAKTDFHLANMQAIVERTRRIVERLREARP